jgi:DNA-binding transcriptional ArsR family regulator
MPTATANNLARQEARARVIKAMAHPVRLRLLECLAQGPKCVCDLQEVAGLDMSTVSKHLHLMRDAGLIDSERRGQWVHYSLRCACILNFMKCVDEVLLDAAEKHRSIAGACRIR